MATQGAYKKIGPGGYTVYPYVVHKTWNVDESMVGEATSSDQDPDIQIYKGILNNKTGSTGYLVEPYFSSSVSGDTIFRQVRHLYYGGAPHSETAYAFRSSSGFPHGFSGYDATKIGNGARINEPFNTFGSNNNSKVYKNLHTGSLTWLSIPYLCYGDGIQKKSVTLTDKSSGTSLIIKDDGEGNLYDTGFSSSLKSAGSSSISASYVGNVFYEHGNFIFIPPTASFDGSTETYNTGQYGKICQGRSNSDGFDLTFNNNLTNFEVVVDCVAGENEFNFTMNDSIRTKYSGSEKTEDYEGQLIDMATGSTFEPYITTIGLYDDNRRLLAVGKLGRPIRKDPKLSFSFKVRFDI